MEVRAALVEGPVVAWNPPRFHFPMAGQALRALSGGSLVTWDDTIHSLNRRTSNDIMDRRPGSGSDSRIYSSHIQHVRNA